MPLQIRRGSSIERLAITPLDGELIWDQTTKRLYIGDGTTLGGNTATEYTDIDAVIAVGTALDNGTHDGIIFTYDENNISAVLSDVNASVLSGSANIKIIGNDSSIIVDSDTNSIVASSGSFDNLSVPGFLFNNGLLNLGSATIDGSLRVTRNTYSSSIFQGIMFQQYHETPDAVNLNFLRGRGTSPSPTIVQNNDDIGDITFWANNGTLTPSGVANMSVTVDGIPTSGQPVNGKFVFSLNNGISPLVSPKAELLSSGTWSVNQLDALTDSTITALSPITGDLIGSIYADGSTIIIDAQNNFIFTDSIQINQFLKLPIYADDTERQSVIPFPEQGMIIFMQSGTTPSTTNRPQYFDGTNWQNF